MNEKMSVDQQLEIERLWDVLRGKTTLWVAMRTVEASEELQQKAETALAGEENFSTRSALYHACRRIAYRKLLELGEIDSGRYFNTATGDYYKARDARQGDIYIKGDHSFCGKIRYISDHEIETEFQLMY